LTRPPAVVKPKDERAEPLATASGPDAVLRFMAPDGSWVRDPPPPLGGPSELIRLLEAMERTRAFDAKAIALQRTGRLGTYPSCLGQEAVGVGVGVAMRPEDVLLPSYREQAAQLLRGVTPVELLLYWAGDERGSDFGGPRRDFPVSVPVASHAPHAVGVALAMQLRGEARVAVCVLGDGATSKGDFYEALNLAGVRRLPVVFVVVDNGWAISTPREAQTAAPTLAHKALAVGMPAERVDGNDVVAMTAAMRESLGRARDGGGATLIEAVTYRLGDHTTADDASRYRDDAEVSRRWREEPIARVRAHLVARDALSREDEEGLLAGAASWADEAATDFLAVAPERPDAMFEHLYARLPAPLERQRQAAREVWRDA
jgi:2-oxoisovalerate dehydrogenase E1 component subunit alpha